MVIKLSLESNKEIVKQQFRMISEGDAKGAAALWAPNSLNHGHQVAREDLAKIFESLIMLQQKFTIHEQVAEGDWVACRATVSGQHSAQPNLPIDSGIYNISPPKGERFTFQHLHLFKISDGLIVEHWANRDDLGAARQIGLELAPSARDSKS
jgi:predicted ester cyclase